MSDYSKSTNFTTKDTLPTGNSGKIVKGTEIDTEFTNIASAISSKANSDSPTFTGVPSSPTAVTGTNTSQIANTAFVKNAIDTATASLGTMATQNASSVAITGGTITGITDLTVADGGTGSSTLTANAVLLGNGTSALQTVAPGTTGNILTSNGTTWASSTLKGLGFGGETWHDVSSSRSSGTPYTNSNGYPIMIAVSTSNSTAQGVTIVVGGVTVSSTIGGGSGYTQGVMGTAIVPTGSTYSVTYYGVSPKWTELY